MIDVRHSDALKPNPDVSEIPAREGESNREWLARAGAGEGVLLLGGATLSHFRIRVAQSHLRHDMLPSPWSQCGLLTGGGEVITVPLETGPDVSLIPDCNGVRRVPLAEFDDPARFPNVAILRFADNYGPVLDRSLIGKVMTQRAVADLPAAMLAWLAFVWGVGHAGNPLFEEKGLPCAALVEILHSMAGVELTPGLSSSASCPEAIWQAARWWSPYYAAAAELETGSPVRAVVPRGAYVKRQPSAAVTVTPWDYGRDAPALPGGETFELRFRSAGPGGFRRRQGKRAGGRGA